MFFGPGNRTRPDGGVDRHFWSRPGPPEYWGDAHGQS